MPTPDARYVHCARDRRCKITSSIDDTVEEKWVADIYDRIFGDLPETYVGTGIAQRGLFSESFINGGGT